MELCMSTRGCTHGERLLASQIKRWALSWSWPFRRRSCRHRLSLQLSWWDGNSQVDEALGSVGKELNKTKKASMLLHKPVVHPCLAAAGGESIPSDGHVLGLTETQRCEGASLQEAQEQMRALWLQKQQLRANMTGQRNWTGMNCSLSLPAWELEAVNEGARTQQTTGHDFLT